MKARAALLAGAAMALQAPGMAAATDQPLWELGLGAGVLQLPHYRGADQSHTWALPVPYVAYRGRIFKADRDGARALLVETSRLSIDLSASASTPTRSRDNRAREGMPDLAPTLELGPNLNWTLGHGRDWKLDLRLPVRAAVTVESHPRLAGWTSAPNLNLDLRSGRWNLGLLAGPVLGTRGLHGFYYGVAPQLATAARPSYRAPGGYAGLSAIAAASRRDGDRWMGAFVKYDHLGGASFAASPLLRQRQQWSFGLAVSWIFAASERRVSVDE